MMSRKTLDSADEASLPLPSAARPVGLESCRAASLFLALDCRCPAATLPHRIALSDADEVHVRPANKTLVAREAQGDRRIVTIGVADPGIVRPARLLVRGAQDGAWHIPPRTKAGALITDGPLEGSTTASDGDVFSCGHAIFLYREGRSQSEGPAVHGTTVEATPALETLQPLLNRQFAMLGRVARSSISVMILGETGTGKEMVARTIHALSGRQGRLVAVNCGALPETLLQSELFGHRKGAFSGAVEDREGLIRAAQGGTLLLDEIGDLPLSSQATFLRVLQEKEVHPIGATRAVSVDVRVITATHCDLTALVRRGMFRADLFARLIGYRIELPPLRLRLEDVGLILATLLRRQPNPESVSLTPAAGCALFRHSWPLNIRELERYLMTALVLAQGEPIDLGHLADAMHDGPSRPGLAPPPSRRTRTTRDDHQTRGELMALLSRHRGNVSAVAAQMGKSRMQIHRWARRFGLDLDSFR
jgi:DNA-binding NtrC family response regulator